jgi:hypothetical protein
MGALFRIQPNIRSELLNILAVFENASQRLLDRFFIQDIVVKF